MMVNKRGKTKKPKQSAKKPSGQKGGMAGFEDVGSPKPVRKQPKKK